MLLTSLYIPTMKYGLGRYVYGLAAIAFGICAFAFHDINTWQQVKALANDPHREILTYIVATIEILGGAAILWPRTARAGAIAVGAIYCIFALLGLPAIIAHPLVYNGFGNFFEQFSLAAPAMILAARWARLGYYAFGICVLSFALEQLFYLSATAGLVPKWIPPGQMFWAIATTAAFALAAFALLTGFKARLAARLTTAMLLGFGLLVWLPALFAAPHSFENWSEAIETFAIAASAWVVADYLDRR
jgi:uncharacterized membrane protein YphA (DoxX/SURF4 family)